jgi:hypothetical protein
MIVGATSLMFFISIPENIKMGERKKGKLGRSSALHLQVFTVTFLLLTVNICAEDTRPNSNHFN